MITPKSGRLLAIDHGLKRIGLAVSDLSWLVARELTIIQRASKVEDFEKINRIAHEQSAVAYIVGMPYNDHLDEDTYSQADRVKLWSERFGKTTQLPIIFWDEQFTSQEAQELSRLAKRTPRDPVDDLAARVILQSYLDALHDGLTTLPPELSR